MAMGEQHNHQRLELPLGFRFHPTDEEIITHYLTHKALDKTFSTIAIGEIDVNKFEPWELPGKLHSIVVLYPLEYGTSDK